MKNKLQVGNVVTFTAAAAIAGGAGLLLGRLFGVVVADVAVGAEGELDLTGGFELPKTEAQAWTFGAAIYWDDTNDVCTTTVGSNVKIGHAIASAASGTTVGDVRLSGASG